MFLKLRHFPTCIHRADRTFIFWMICSSKYSVKQHILWNFSQSALIFCKDYSVTVIVVLFCVCVQFNKHTSSTSSPSCCVHCAADCNTLLFINFTFIRHPPHTFRRLSHPPAPQCHVTQQSHTRPIYFQVLGRVGDQNAIFMEVIPKLQQPENEISYQVWAAWAKAPRIWGLHVNEGILSKPLNQSKSLCLCWQLSYNTETVHVWLYPVMCWFNFKKSFIVYN